MTSFCGWAEVVPESTCVAIDGSAGRPVAPYAAQEFFAGEHAVRVAGQRDQQLVFLGGELDRLLAEADLASGEIDGERPEPQLPAVAPALGAAQNGGDPGA